MINSVKQDTKNERLSKKIVSIELPYDFHKDSCRYSSGSKPNTFDYFDSRPETARSSGIIHSIPKYHEKIKSLPQPNESQTQRKMFFSRYNSRKICGTSQKKLKISQDIKNRPQFSLFGKRLNSDEEKLKLSISNQTNKKFYTMLKNENNKKDIEKNGHTKKKKEKFLKRMDKDSLVFKVTGKKLTRNGDLCKKILLKSEMSSLSDRVIANQYTPSINRPIKSVLSIVT